MPVLFTTHFREAEMRRDLQCALVAGTGHGLQHVVDIGTRRHGQDAEVAQGCPTRKVG